MTKKEIKNAMYEEISFLTKCAKVRTEMYRKNHNYSDYTIANSYVNDIIAVLNFCNTLGVITTGEAEEIETKQRDIIFE